VCPEDVAALRARARLAERSGDVEAAAGLLAEVVRIRPGDDDARRHRDLLLAGPDRDRFELPYRRDAVELAALPLPESRDEPFEVLDRTTVWRVHPDGTEHRYEHMVLRVLDQGGVKQLDTYTIPAWGDTQAYVYNVRVIRPDGSFERAPPSRGWRWYDLPPLRPGDLVDVEYRLDQRQADVFGEYFGTRHEFYPDQFDGFVPTRRAELVVIAPPDVPIHVAERRAERLERHEETDADGNTVLRWVASDLPRPPVESKMPKRSEIAPVVDLTTFRDWDAFATWWWAFIQKEFVTTPAMRAKVAELTAGLDTEQEQVAAIARFVGQEIRYNAWPFGTHGYEPFSAATIFERRFGDCKDKSILLRQMLAEIDVEAVPVLIDAEYERADEPLEAAMVGLFNHCIAWLPPTGEREGYYLDATADRNPVEYLRADDQGARVLHVSGEGGSLHDIPYAPPVENAVRRVWTVTLDDEGAGTVGLRDESNGLFGVRMRTRYGGEQGDLPTELAKELAGSFGQVQVQSVVTSDLDDITQPATLDATFTARNLWTREGVLRTLRTGFDDLGFAGVATESEAERDFDLVLDRPFAHDTTVEWRLPPGAALERLPPDVDIDAPGLLRYRQRAERVEGGVAVHRRFELLDRRIGREQYASFRNALREVKLAEARTVAVRPGPTDEGR
jgi:transglutaminase-like putative cysteine protease